MEPARNRLLNRKSMLYKHLGDSGQLLDGKNAVLLLVCNYVQNQLIRNNFLVIGKAIYEGCVAKHVNHAGIPPLAIAISAHASLVKSGRGDPTACKRNAM